MRTLYKESYMLYKENYMALYKENIELTLRSFTHEALHDVMLYIYNTPSDDRGPIL